MISKDDLILEDAVDVINWIVDTVDEVSYDMSLAEAIGTISNFIADKPVLDEMPFARIRNLFATAQKHVEWPKIKLGGEDLNITLSCNKKDQINITNGERYGSPDNIWFGRIENKYGLHKLNLRSKNGEDANLRITAILQAFNDDPAGYAKVYGDMYGSCMYCGKKLTHPQSVVVGYGPTCAVHYGLPWGDVLNADKLVETEMEVAG